jgi:hypothetical protein
MMKTSIVFLSVITLFACNNQPKQEENKNLLPTDLVNNPRSAAGTDTTALNEMAEMQFRDTVHDFGAIKEGESVTYDFEFTNTGKKPLVISNAAGSCGCTVADFPREPMAPGKSSVVKVQFSSIGKHGHQEKSVSLTTNSKRGTHVLYIKGDVQEKK